METDLNWYDIESRTFIKTPGLRSHTHSCLTHGPFCKSTCSAFVSKSFYQPSPSDFPFATTLECWDVWGVGRLVFIKIIDQ